MGRCVELMYTYGQMEKAQKYFDMMKKEKMPEVTGLTLDQFAYKIWEKNMEDSGFKKRMEMITAMITQSTYLLAYGDYQGAESFLALAKLSYDRHMNDMGKQERQALKPFAQIRKEIMENLMGIMPPDLAQALRGELNSLE